MLLDEAGSGGRTAVSRLYENQRRRIDRVKRRGPSVGRGRVRGKFGFVVSSNRVALPGAFLLRSHHVSLKSTISVDTRREKK